MKKLRCIVIGLGKQSQEDHIPALTTSNNFEIVGVCDLDEVKVVKISDRLGVEGSVSVENLLFLQPDVAIISVPHLAYENLIQICVSNKIHVIKDKPLAISFESAKRINDLVKGKILLGVLTQRRFNPIYATFPSMVKHIGEVYFFEARYVMNIERLDEGWRSRKDEAGGGALIDLGYHIVDLLVWYFGLPLTVNSRISHGNRTDQEYDVEDTAIMMLDFNHPTNHSKKLIGNIVISRVFPEKNEELIAYGSKGTIVLKRGEIIRYNNNGEIVEQLSRKGSWPSAFVEQIDYFASQINDGQNYGLLHQDVHLNHSAIIEAAYMSASKQDTIKPHQLLK